MSRGIISVTMTKNSHHTAGPLNTKGPYSGHLISSLEASYHPPDSTGKAQPSCKKVQTLISFLHHYRHICEIGVFGTLIQMATI
jgi:hypothetical protein